MSLLVPHPLLSFSTSTTSGETSVDPVGAAAAAVPPPSTSDDFDIHRTLETVMIVQAAHSQILVDMLDELHTLRVNLAHLRHSPSPPPFDDGFWLPFDIPSQKGGVHL